MLTIITALLSGCACECDDDFPLLKVEFRNYSLEELKTIYIVSDGTSDTCFTCIDTISNSALIYAQPYTRFQITSDSISLHKTLLVNKISSETPKYGPCKCTNITGIDYEYEGSKYTSEPIVITK